MRVEEKQVDGLELELQEQLETVSSHDRQGTEFAAHASAEIRHTSAGARDQIVAAVRAIFAHQGLTVADLGLPQREERALEALQAAVTGKSANLGMFVYAEDRRSLLEQALAVLQPNLVGGDGQELAGLRDQLSAMTERVATLREELMQLEDAQEELLGEQREVAKATKPDEPVDPAATPTPVDGERPASTLAGPGPAVTSQAAPSTLTGPERAVEARPPTSVGDPAEIEEAARQAAPWWRRPGD